MTAPGARTYGEREFMKPAKSKSQSPASNRHLEYSNKDRLSKNLKLPHPFQSRPKVSRTPPNAPEGFSSRNELIRHHTKIVVNQGDGNSDTVPADSNERTSISFNSPSLSIEYPPGAQIPIIKPRTKFHFKKSHYQRFVGTSSALKTNSRRFDTPRSNSIVSDFHDSHGMMDTIETVLPIHSTRTTMGYSPTGGGPASSSNGFNGGSNEHNGINGSGGSLPPSPPSDQAVGVDSPNCPKRPKSSIISRASFTAESNCCSQRLCDYTVPSILCTVLSEFHHLFPPHFRFSERFVLRMLAIGHGIVISFAFGYPLHDDTAYETRSYQRSSTVDRDDS